MAWCIYCEQEMLDKVGCTMKADRLGDRIPNGDEPCHDCGAPPHTLHHPGCDMERCSKCGRQAISCGCQA